MNTLNTTTTTSGIDSPTDYLARCAMGVDVNIATWGATTKDRSAGEVLTSTNGASQDSVSVIKNLMTGHNNPLKALTLFAAECRARHQFLTLPWANRGTRLLPAKLFQDYKQEVDKRKAKFDQMVEAFLREYPMLVDRMKQDNTLGTLFNPADYPSVNAVRNKFYFKVTFSPLPTANDFRIQMTDEAITMLRNQYEESFNERMADAMREPWERLYKALTHISEKLTDAEGEKKRYFDTLLSNARDLCDLLGSLNVTNDTRLEKARQDVLTALQGTSIEMIREHAHVRADVKAKVDAVLGGFDW